MAKTRQVANTAIKYTFHTTDAGSSRARIWPPFDNNSTPGIAPKTQAVQCREGEKKPGQSRAVVRAIRRLSVVVFSVAVNGVALPVVDTRPKGATVREFVKGHPVAVAMLAAQG